MKTVLINPFVVEASTFPSGEFFSCTAPNMGLAYIAASLECAGYEVEILDANALRMQPESLKAALVEAKPDVIGVTATTTTLLDAYAVVRAARFACPQAYTVMGGIHVSRFPEESLRECPELDIVSIGEGEETFVELLCALEQSACGGDIADKLAKIRGIAFWEDEHVVVTEPRPCISNLDSLPMPARHLLPLEKYASAGHPHRTASIVSSRGCPFGCKFCAAPFIAGSRYRARSAASLLDEIGEIVGRYHMSTFEFVDDLFTLDKQRVFDLCEGIHQRAYEVNWTCSARADSVTPELLHAMAGAGCRIVYYGIESGSQRVLDLIDKRETLEQMKQAVTWTHGASMRTWGFFILGFPEETREEIETTINFASELELDYAEFFICSAFPGSPLYERAISEGLIQKEKWSDISYGKANIRSNFISAEQLESYLVEAYRRFYTSPRVRERLRLYGQEDLVAEIERQTAPGFDARSKV